MWMPLCPRVYGLNVSVISMFNCSRAVKRMPHESWGNFLDKIAAYRRVSILKRLGQLTVVT